MIGFFELFEINFKIILLAKIASAYMINGFW